MIPVRVDPAVKAHVVKSGMDLDFGHWLYRAPCPVCEEPMADGVSLVYVGRKKPGWTAASVAVHDACTDTA